MDPKTVEIEPLLAESFEPSADFKVWTLKLHDGIVFTDDSPYDAAAVQGYWTRIQDPANRSPAVSAAGTIASMRVVDPLTLEITLKTPNAHFDRTVERQSFNYVPSPKAVAAGHDFTNDPVGAGPFVLDSWVRDDRMTMSANPKWKGSDGPHVDKLVIRTVYDEQQRSDTFTKGDADINFVGNINTSIEAGKKAGANWIFVTTPGSPAFVFNNAKPPFDDVRVRKAFIQAIDRNALAKIISADQSIDNWTFEDSPYYTPDATIPPYDPAAAQALFDEVAAEQGGPIKIKLGGSQQSLDVKRMEFLQTQLSGYDNVEATVDIADSPTAIGRVLQKDYEVHSWGFPHMDPEPNLYNNAHSGLFTNYSQYSNAQVDAALDEARQTRDQAKRVTLYQQVYRQLAKDVPWWPYLRYDVGFLAAPDVHDVILYHEGILRSDLVWKEQ
jgi:peptide/nickel transport system substrate-binding protein